MEIDNRYRKRKEFSEIYHIHKKYEDNVGNKQISAPHEFDFINLLYLYEFLKDKDIARQFAMYVAQTSSYEWACVDPNAEIKLNKACEDHKLFQYIDEKLYQTTFLECALRAGYFKMVYDLKLSNSDKSKVEFMKSTESFYRAMHFGDIATEFMIRHLGYSLIGNSDQKVIITSMSDCGKRFESYLEQGYSLQRLARTQYIRLTDEQRTFYPELTGYFKFLPVLPTNSPYKVDEVIETSLDVKRYMKVIN